MRTTILGTGVSATVLISFLIVVGLSLLLCVLFGSDSDNLTDFYTAKRTLSPLQNGLALAGDYMSATTLLVTTGVVALAGFDGFTLALSILLSLGVLLVLAKAMRNAGRFTLGDILELRASGRGPRIAAAIATLAASLPFLVVQLSGAGTTTALLLGSTSSGTQQACTFLIGAVMVIFAALGGMKSIGVIQIIKVPLILGVMLALLLPVLSHFHWNPSALLHAATQGSEQATFLSPGNQYGNSTAGWLNQTSLEVTVVLTACMPHVLTRVSCAADGDSARRATRHAINIIAALLLAMVLTGVGAAAMVGSSTIAGVTADGQATLLMLAGSLYGGIGTTAGSMVFTAVAAAVFLAVLAAVANVTLAAAAGLAHDLVAHAITRGAMSQAKEVRVAQWSSVAMGVVGIGLALAAHGSDMGSLVIFAIGVCGSTIFPALVYSLFWRRYSRNGLLWTVYGGLAGAVVLQALSPTVSGTPDSLFPNVDFALSPLDCPGLFSIPIAFLLGWIATVTSRDLVVAEEASLEVEARILLGSKPDERG